MTEKGISLSDETITRIAAAETRGTRWTAAALWVIAALVLIFVLSH